MSAQERFDQYIREQGDARADRALAHALLSGPHPREPLDTEYFKPYYENAARVVGDFRGACENNRGAGGPEQSDIERYFQRLWVSVESAVRFCDSWSDKNACARTFAFVYNLEISAAKQIDWTQVFYEFFLVAADLAPAADRNDGRPDSRLVHDLLRDFDDLHRSAALAHVVDTSCELYRNISALCDTVSKMAKSAYCDNRLPLIIDPTARLLEGHSSNKLSGLLHVASARPAVLRQFVKWQGPPPCILMAVNRQQPQVLDKLRAFQHDVIEISLDLYAGKRLNECLNADADTTRH